MLFLGMSIETRTCLSDDYEVEIAQMEETTRAYRMKRKARTPQFAESSCENRVEKHVIAPD